VTRCDDLFEPMDSSGALRRLQEGNRRYVSGQPARPPDLAHARSLLAEKGQRPFAVVLGCSDSRVPPEIVFDESIGRIFTVRTAGNVADAIVVGSVEYAAEHLHAPLVVVLGHQKCGAVAAALSGGEHGANIGAIIEQIRPSLDKTRGAEDAACRCEDENIRNTVRKLRESPVLSKLVSGNALQIIGAKYSVETGEVNFGIDQLS